MMRVKKAGILALIMALAFMIGPVSAATWNVNSTSNIQSVIDDNATVGDTINFTADTGSTYTGVALTATKNNLIFAGNGVTLVGGGTSIFTITNTTGVTIRDFIININNDTADGITGSKVYDCTIDNNTITNGEDGINIFMEYGGLTITNNRINDMNSGRDGISLVNHLNLTDLSSLDPTVIENNIIDDVDYGIFLGGNFKGDIIGNSISGTIAGMNITGKRAADNGKLDAYIAGNTITGIAMECPHVVGLTLFNNAISQVGTTGYSILTNGYFGWDPYAIWVIYNQFSAPVDAIFRASAYIWMLNF